MTNVTDTKPFLITATAIALLYLLLAGLLMNYRLVAALLFTTQFPVITRAEILTRLFIGMSVTMSGLAFAQLLAIAILTGVNFSWLIFSKRACPYTGGTTLLSILGTGCSSCGLPVFAVLGLGSLALALPGRGGEISIISISLLCILLIRNIRKTEEVRKCP